MPGSMAAAAAASFLHARLAERTGVPTGAYRMVPDVALVADPNTGGYLIFNGQLVHRRGHKLGRADLGRVLRDDQSGTG